MTSVTLFFLEAFYLAHVNISIQRHFKEVQNVNG